MALFKRNDNKDQAAEDLAEDLAEGAAEDTSQDAPGANAEDALGEDSAPEQAPASRKRFGKPNRKPKPKRNLRGVVRIEELEQALADQDLDDIDPDAVVSTDALDNGTNIAAEDLPDNLDDIDGSHNGKNYVAYSFYIRNAGKTDLGYSAKLKVVSASKGVEKAARVRVYRNGEPTTYAAAAADGNPEPNTEPFASKDVVTTISHKNFRVGDVDKYTVVIWLDGDDPECVDKIIGGAVEFGFDFDSSETDDSSLFVKFVQDIADTLTGNDPISASGNEAPDYYKEHNVTWSNRRNQKNSPAGDGDK